MQNKHQNFFLVLGVPTLGGGVDLVGPNSQIFPKIRFEGSPYLPWQQYFDWLIWSQTTRIWSVWTLLSLSIFSAQQKNRSIKNIWCTYSTGRKWKSCIKSWWWCPDMISQRSCWDIMFEDNFCQIKVWMHSKIDQTSLFCAFKPLPS